MINFFNYLYEVKYKISCLDRIRLYSLYRFIVRRIANIALPTYFLLTKSNNNKSKSKKSDHRVIVTLTSFPTRINKVWLTIESILRQSYKPDLIILWLSKNQFPNKRDLPKRLLNLEKRGLRIEFREGDLRSHKKYYYTLQEFPEDIMITMDDDILYPNNSIEELLKAHKIYPEDIICRYGYMIKVIGNQIGPYKLWDRYYQQSHPSSNIFFGSGGGTLFPPKSLPPETLNQNIFTKLCLNADDIWLNTMCRLNNKKVYNTQGGLCSILPVLFKDKVTLSKKNLDQDHNDELLHKVRTYYKKELCKDPYEGLFA